MGKIRKNPLTPFYLLVVLGIGLFLGTLVGAEVRGRVESGHEEEGGGAKGEREDLPARKESNEGVDKVQETKTYGSQGKQIIGYITHWDAWKGEEAGVPAQGALTHLNVDFSKYTILNYSFFGVARDGSLHSGDFRNKNIYQDGVVQEPAPLLFTDIYSSWDLFLLFGELEGIHHINADIAKQAATQGFEVTEGGGTWSNSSWGLYDQPLPLPLKKEGGAPGVFDMAKQNNVKVMASIGGWSMSKHFPEVAADSTKRAVFVEDCVRLINMGFDGIDLDWEYPGPSSGMNFTGTDADYDNFITLTKEIREAIGDDKLITSCFSADTKKLDSFNWNNVNKYVDYFNFMSYDMNGGWSNIAGHNSPLYGYSGSEAPDFNWDFLYNYLANEGVNLSKVNMGIGFYGRGVITDGVAALNAKTLKREENIQPDGNVTTCADLTNWAAHDGAPNYHYIKDLALAPNSGWERHWDNDAKVPYLTKDNFFLSYDDEESIRYKAEYIKDKNLAGTIIWTAYGDLEMGGSHTTNGTKLKKWLDVKSPLVDVVNEVFGKEPGTTGENVIEPQKPKETVEQEEPVVTEKPVPLVEPSNEDVPSWDAGKVYTGGEIVEFKGSKWLANWWTQGEEPGTTGQWGAWTEQ